MNRRKQGVLVVLTVFMSCLLVAYLAVITTHHNGLTLFARHHESWHSGDNDSWSGSGTQSELYPTPVFNPTCQALEQLAATSGTCTTSDQCTGLNCVVIGIGSVDFRIEPCHNPPAVHVVGKDASGIVIVNETLTKSRQESVGLGTLNINIMQSPNEDSISISVTASVVAGIAPVTIIPETTIPLNRAQCPHAVTPTQPTTTHTFTPLRMPSPTPRVSETCDSLQQLASSSQLCITNVQCSGLHCELPGGVTGSFDVTVEPCHNPPAVNVVQRNALGEVIYNETLTKSRKENFGLGTLNINLMQSPNEDSISINVTVSVVAGTAPVTIIPETTIPLNRAQCPHAVTPTTTRTFTPLRMPSPTPRVSETCDSLQQLASSSQLCVTNVQCSGLHCELPGGVTGSFDVTVEPCHNPPAVNVVQRNALGEVIYNETLTKSRKENFGLGTLNINLMQSPNEDSISINVTVSVVAGTAPVTIIPETTIPLNRAQCPRAVTPTQPTTTRTFTPLRMPSPTPRASETCESLQQLASSSQSSSRPPMGTFYTAVIVTTTRNTSTMVSPSKLPSGSSQSITIAVAVPVTILLVSIGGIVMLVAIVMAIRRHKRVRREYHFQRMTFNTDNDDDDDDNDL